MSNHSETSPLEVAHDANAVRDRQRAAFCIGVLMNKLSHLVAEASLMTQSKKLQKQLESTTLNLAECLLTIIVIDYAPEVQDELMQWRERIPGCRSTVKPLHSDRLDDLGWTFEVRNAILSNAAAHAQTCRELVVKYIEIDRVFSDYMALGELVDQVKRPRNAPQIAVRLDYEKAIANREYEVATRQKKSGPYLGGMRAELKSPPPLEVAPGECQVDNGWWVAMRACYKKLNLCVHGVDLRKSGAEHAVLFAALIRDHVEKSGETKPRQGPGAPPRPYLRQEQEVTCDKAQAELDLDPTMSQEKVARAIGTTQPTLSRCIQNCGRNWGKMKEKGKRCREHCDE